MDQQWMGDIFRRFLNNECSPEETEQLMDWLQQPENQLLWRGWVRGQLAENMDARTEGSSTLPEHLERRLQTILQQINAEVEPDSAPKEVKFIRRRLVAAVLIGLLGIAGMLVYRQSKNTPVSAKAITKIDIAPGGNKAVLTLGNGREIVLDDASNDTLAKQGNATIIKTKGGKLAYKVSNEKPADVVYNTLATPKGGEFELTLPDGSITWLNSASSIRYPTVFTGKDRIVEVTGEAYFDIKKNPAQPFKVRVNGKEEVEVLGTSFNINSYDDEQNIKTTLIDGAVKISTFNVAAASDRQHKDQNPPSKPSPEPSVIIKPGEQAQLFVGDNTNKGGESQEFKIVKDVDIDEILAWKQGMFLFNSSDLQTIMRQVSRWYDVDMIYQDKYTNQHFGGGISRKLNLSQVLKLLETNGVVFKLEGRSLTVLPKQSAEKL